ncbi:MAG: ATP-binding response regulator, partial [Terracidiphilus sp.]
SMADPRCGSHKPIPRSPLDVIGKFGDEAFSALFDTSEEALIIVSTDGILQRANARARDLLRLTPVRPSGLALSDFLSTPSTTLLTSLSSERTRPRHVDIALTGGRPVRVTLRSILPDTLHLLLCLDENAASPASLGGTSSRQLRSELLSILNSVQAGIIIFNFSGQLRFFNSRFAEFLDLETPQLENLATFDELAETIASKFRAPGAFSARWKSFKAGNIEPAREELEIVQPRARLLERFSRPVLDSEGRATGWLEIYSDVTESRQIQSKMQQTEKMAALGQVVSGIAHELNNPLTAIMGYAQLLLGHGLLPAQLTQARSVYQEAERARRIVKNLLYFARENKPERTVVDLNEIVERTVALRSYELKVENIAVQLDLSPGLPSTMADPYQLQQVVLNLLMNAEQALQEERGGGRVVIRTRLLRQQIGNRLSLEVSDDGPGIPPEIASRIFDPFFTTKAAAVGTGLGLSIVYGIVRQHDGDVAFENEPNGGAKFLIELPVVAIPAGQRQMGERPASTSPAAPGSILVVEDEPTVARLIADILLEEGHRVEA